MSKPVIHYLWVGSPTKTDPSAVAGHDIAGPIKMAKELKRQAKSGEEINPVKFWCLAKHAEFYRRQFKSEGVNIQVCSIEGLLRKESSGDLADRVKFVQSYMAESLENEKDVKQRVAFKDLFSLLLLVTQGGYFFDTNVFPEKDKTISLLGEPTVTTAKSGFQQSNDFYMMYSPTRAHPIMLKIFDAWRKTPGLGNLSAFSVDKIPYFDFDKEMGVKKTSYKSYWNGDARGLFYWLDRRPEEFEENLKFGDINQQRTYPSSAKALHDFSLCYLKPPVTEEALLSMPFTTNEAYVASGIDKLYYVNKSTKTCVLVYNESTTLFDIFPSAHSTSKIELAEPSSILRIIDAVENPCNGMPIPNVANCHPEYIINTKNCTLLHQAVLNNNVGQVKSLLKHGARLDLIATYQIKPSGKILEVTPGQLAKYLKYEEMAFLLQAHENQETPAEHPALMEENENESKINKEKIVEILDTLIANIKEGKGGRFAKFKLGIDAKVGKLNDIALRVLDAENINEQKILQEIRNVCAEKRNPLGFFKPHSLAEFEEMVSENQLKHG
ncbi:hypothetical protein [Legionella brunensis]|uniref:Uncharacterized protein n=1 Tax=Legionella brunensis TaxID=29422 RepID=A0A0W0SDN8_9GAMM|nr:hypothetical protein [Legionella brunensis]KTC81567.1 hypothetical protein Lbru_2087 [Legionella brunensis]